VHFVDQTIAFMRHQFACPRNFSHPSELGELAQLAGSFAEKIIHLERRPWVFDRYVVNNIGPVLLCVCYPADFHTPASPPVRRSSSTRRAAASASTSSLEKCRPASRCLRAASTLRRK